MSQKILILGDLHFRPKLGYADQIHDGRLSEEKEVLDFIFDQSSDCGILVFLGDQLDARNNTSEVIRKFVNFVERFNDGTKQIFMISGNHCKTGDGKTAMDFYQEINDPNIHVITNKIEKVGGMVFCPYFYKGELGCKDYPKASKELIKMLPDGEILFAHHTLSDLNIKGISSNTFNEIILPRKKLVTKFKRVVAGHIHLPSDDGRFLVAGSIFNQECGEDGKFIYKMDAEMNIEKIALPGRKIIKMENPTLAQIEALENIAIVKVILNKKISKEEVEEIRKLLTLRVESFSVIEEFKNERKKASVEPGKLDFSVDNLLELYATQKKISLDKLKAGFELVKS